MSALQKYKQKADELEAEVQRLRDLNGTLNNERETLIALVHAAYNGSGELVKALDFVRDKHPGPLSPTWQLQHCYTGPYVEGARR